MKADKIKNCATCKYNVNFLENGIGECKKNPNHFGGYPPEYDICTCYAPTTPINPNGEVRRNEG